MKVTHVRPTPAGNALTYRLALSLHTSFIRDAEFASLDLMNLSRSAVREMISSIERTTGLTSSILEHDAEPED